MSLFSFLSGVTLGQHCQKSLAKKCSFRKYIERGYGHIVGVFYRRGFKHSVHYDTEILKEGTLES